MDFSHPELKDNKFAWAQSTTFVVLCYSSNRKLIQKPTTNIILNGEQ